VVHIVLLIVCAAAIYVACEWFVNAVEWLGRYLRVGAVAVGTVLAAIGTALPESVVTLSAVIGGASHASKQIGIGAAMGGPLVLATIAYGVVGLMLWRRQRAEPAPAADNRRHNGVNIARLARDQRWFLAIFAVKVSLGLAAFAYKRWLGLAFFAVYLIFILGELRTTRKGSDNARLAPLRLQRKREIPASWAVALQTFAALAVVFAASQIFVRQLEWAGPQLGLAPAVVALLLSPIATELPEILNAVIWIRQGKDQLALANISGAMMIQATIPSGLGLLFTSWRFDAALLLAGVVTAAAIVYLLVLARIRQLSARTLSAAAGFYLLLVGGLVVVA
jgi:cation:H+ antiporter